MMLRHEREIFMNTYAYDEIEIGKTESFSVTVTEDMLDGFKNISGDLNPLHTDREYAVSMGYSGRVCYGMLTASFLSTLAGVFLPGKYSLIQSVEIKFAEPVYVGDELLITGEVTDRNDTYKLIFLKVTIRNSDGKKVCRGKMQIQVQDNAERGGE
jgi:3-hydroxybutyryl-CoA dehydratase